jgi:hypothetical protein
MAKILDRIAAMTEQKDGAQLLAGIGEKRAGAEGA